MYGIFNGHNTIINYSVSNWSKIRVMTVETVVYLRNLYCMYILNLPMPIYIHIPTFTFFMESL